MRSFRNDYNEIGHINVLKALTDNIGKINGCYGLDEHSENASKMIKSLIENDDANVFFLEGGTQTNLTMISFILKDYEAVISAKTGHINVHEAGSIEATGHKIIEVEGTDGKIYPSDIQKVMNTYIDEHMVKPKMVYISNSTERGTIYLRDELIALYKICKENDLFLFVDGARLGSALMSRDNDIKISDFGKYCDAFYLGGTKNGLLFGEALVINSSKVSKDFRYHIKNKGAMLAKGYVIGIEYEAILKDNLYFDLAKKANEMAYLLSDKLKELGYLVDKVYTNQVFVTCDNKDAERIIELFNCELWSDLGDKKVVRFVTTYSVTVEDILELYRVLKK